jgi:hypothetical protein
MAQGINSGAKGQRGLSKGPGKVHERFLFLILKFSATVIPLQEQQHVSLESCNFQE